MLKLSNITKKYYVANTTVEALKGINLSFRDNEFVAILGPSGCGKTTLLNIIGGLDRYTSGDLFIAGKSTKEFSDRDWDVYRNHRVGFIFQSYNLIPHQTILGNVELALTIAGISKEERVERAKKAIDEVGLKGQYNKKPNQLSGGQCQRVAIARALVNEPEILLADEPTGALDSTTSEQIMELIKKIAEKRLVIMVTHNKELAEEYASRIVNLFDGEVLSDSKPYDEKIEEYKKEEKKEKAKMSFFTAFKLSLRNLFSKKGRTILTCIAGSIGIVGVSSVLALSSGIKNYIASMQDDMLSGNPIAVYESTIDFNSLLNNTPFEVKKTAVKEYGFVNVDSMIEYLVSRSKTMDSIQVKNKITKEYLEYVASMPEEYVAAITYEYGLDITNNIYTDFYTDKSNKDNISLSALKNIYTSVLKETDFKDFAGYVTSMQKVFAQAPNDEDYILSQYNILGNGRVAKGKNEIMIVVDKNSSLTDLTLAQLGYFTQEEFINLIYKASNDEKYDEDLDVSKYSYNDLINKKFIWYPNDTIYNKQEGNQLNPFSYNAYYSEGFENGIELEIVGILEPKENISYGCLTRGFYYTESLAKYMIEESKDSEIVNYLNETEKEAFTSTTFNNVPTGITYKYNYTFDGIEHKDVTGFVGSTNSMSSFLSISGMPVTEYYTLSLRNLGGSELANEIRIYPVNFDQKDFVNEYLDRWNGDEDLFVNGKVIKVTDREDVTYNDNLAIIIALINSMINIVTTALIAFTALSLVVSSVMIGIITYVSVVERTKEIGVIRSVGGRKKDVSNLFYAETFIIGLMSGAFGVGTTYLLSIVINSIVGKLTGVYQIASLPITQAIIMIVISILLTAISGVMPARAAAKKDPAVALRTE